QAVWNPAHRVRSLGSSASRSESPKRLKAKTARLMASPGKMAIQGADSAKSTAAPRNMSPHAAVGSWTPRPRKESDDSRRMAWPRNAVSMMRYGAMTLGSMCRMMMRAFPNPAARAASTYGISRMLSAVDRMTSAQRGTMGIVMAMMRFGSVLPRMATMARARMMSGKAMKMSMKRCRYRSTRPPKNALPTPRMAPRVAPTTAAPNPTMRAVRDP